MRTKTVSYCDENCRIVQTKYFKEPYCQTHCAHIAICARCGRAFHTSRRNVKTCSNACRVAYNRSLKKGI